MEVINTGKDVFFEGFGNVSWLTIVLIIITVLIILKFGNIIISNFVKKTIKQNSGTKAAEEKRENTLIAIFSVTLNISVVVIASLIVLSELGINIGPLLAGAGIAGIALGFGAQYLVRDVITGIFIILENQYRIGDVVCFDKTCGIVEKLTLRTTTLRDLDGVVHYVPNGAIKIASNMTQSKSGVNLNVGVAYSSDLDKVENVINEVGEQLTKNKEWKNKILEAPKVLRVDKLGDSSIEFKITGATVPMEQWAVTGELRKRIKKSFDENNIEIPFPQRDVHLKGNTNDK